MLKHKMLLVFLFLIGLMSSGVQAANGDNNGPLAQPNLVSQPVVSTQAQIADESKDTLHIALRDYFKVTEDQVESLSKTPLPDDDLPIVFFIAQRASVDPNSVMVVWSSGLNWTQTAHHFGLNPWIFFISIQGDLKNTPYLKPYHFFKDRDNRVRLSDDDMINLVNLKFIAEQYNRDPREIVQLRTQGKSFRDINDNYAKSNDAAQWDIPLPQAEGTQTPSATAPHHRHGSHALTAPSGL